MNLRKLYKRSETARTERLAWKMMRIRSILGLGITEMLAATAIIASLAAISMPIWKVLAM